MLSVDIKNLLEPLKRAAIICCLGSIVSCAHSVHQYNAGDYSNYAKLKQAKKITAVGKKKYILAKFDNDFVEQAYNNLKNECSSGHITAVSSRYATELGFFSFTESLTLEGYCIN